MFTKYKVEKNKKINSFSYDMWIFFRNKYSAFTKAKFNAFILKVWSHDKNINIFLLIDQIWNLKDKIILIRFF